MRIRDRKKDDGSMWSNGSRMSRENGSSFSAGELSARRVEMPYGFFDESKMIDNYARREKKNGCHIHAANVRGSGNNTPPDRGDSVHDETEVKHGKKSRIVGRKRNENASQGDNEKAVFAESNTSLDSTEKVESAVTENLSDEKDTESIATGETDKTRTDDNSENTRLDNNEEISQDTTKQDNEIENMATNEISPESNVVPEDTLVSGKTNESQELSSLSPGEINGTQETNETTESLSSPGEKNDTPELNSVPGENSAIVENTPKLSPPSENDMVLTELYVFQDNQETSDLPGENNEVSQGEDNSEDKTDSLDTTESQDVDDASDPDNTSDHQENSRRKKKKKK